MFRLAQNRLAPSCERGQRPASLPPPGGSTRMTSRAELAERHARRWRRHEGGRLDDADTAQRATGRGSHLGPDLARRPASTARLRGDDVGNVVDRCCGSDSAHLRGHRREAEARAGRSGQTDVASDEHALDLVGAVIDLGDLGVAQPPLRTERDQVAVRPEQLDAGRGDPGAEGRAVQLDQRHLGDRLSGCASTWSHTERSMARAAVISPRSRASSNCRSCAARVAWMTAGHARRPTRRRRRRRPARTRAPWAAALIRERTTDRSSSG